MSFIHKTMRRFFRKEEGGLIIESVMVLPILVWAYAGLFAYWDAYRSINTVQKAAYTISDLLSRQQVDLNNGYVDGLRDTMNFLLDADQATNLRVTSYFWNGTDEHYQVIWSYSPDATMTALDDGALAGLTDRLPTMYDGDSAVLVETDVSYIPALNFGMEPTTLKQFIVTRPRFLPKICHVDYECTDYIAANNADSTGETRN